jgi:hypothetical protein
VVMACVGGAGRVTKRVGFAGWAVSAAVSGRVGDRVGPGRVAVRLGRLGNASAERDNVPDGRRGASPPPHPMSSNATSARPAVHFARRSPPAAENLALRVTSTARHAGNPIGASVRAEVCRSFGWPVTSGEHGDRPACAASAVSASATMIATPTASRLSPAARPARPRFEDHDGPPAELDAHCGMRCRYTAPRHRRCVAPMR